MTVLITGATGTTGTLITAAARTAGADVRTAARHGADVAFDWYAPDTWPAALVGCDRAYLVPPPGLDVAPAMVPFVELAHARGLRRLVLLGNSVLPRGGPGVGTVWAALTDDDVVLRPSWFMQNTIGEHPLARMIRDDDRIVTATGEGRIGFVDAADIAAVAVHALLDDPAPATELLVTGPETLSYREVAAIVGAARGRPVTYQPVSVEEQARRLSTHYPPAFARALAAGDAYIAAGGEDRVTTCVPDVTGRPAARFADFAAAAFGQVAAASHLTRTPPTQRRTA